MLTTATVRALSATILLVCCLNASPAQAQSGTGSISGQVTDAATGAPLVGADVLIDGTSHSTATDRSGVFRLAGVPAVQYTLLVLYLGHSDERTEVKVSAGIATSVEVKLAPDRFSEEVEVKGQPIGEAGTGAQPATHGSKHYERRIIRSDWILSGSQCRRSRVPHSRRVDRARSGEGRYVFDSRHRATAELGPHRRRAHPGSGIGDAPGAARRRASSGALR